jgi:hypothetical protein
VRRVAGNLAVLLAGLLVAAPSGAIPAPVTPARLEQLAEAVIVGKVVSTTLVGQDRQGDWARASYRSAVTVQKVTKGTLRPGQTIPLLWFSESWVGKGIHPVGRTPAAVFSLCEVVQLYLRRSGDAYGLAAWNGRHTLVQPRAAPWPDAKRRTVRCPASPH